MKSINTFWNWFQDNNQTIKNLINETPKNQKHITFWIDKHLGYYCKELDYILILPKKETDKAELIITANGNADYFKQLIALVDNAPKLKTWKFTAFIQPADDIESMVKGLDHPYIFPELVLKTSQLKFLALDYDEKTQKFDIIVYLKNSNLHCDTKTLSQAIFIIMQNLLGEISLHKNINFVQLAQMPDNADGLIHLYDLQYYIDTFSITDLIKNRK